MFSKENDDEIITPTQSEVFELPGYLDHYISALNFLASGPEALMSVVQRQATLQIAKQPGNARKHLKHQAPALYLPTNKLNKFDIPGLRYILTERTSGPAQSTSKTPF